ncbi:MAG: hypothetical protein HYX40_07165 [Sphingobacteriales bacterium]|nr:hypothetical protein [Sphingobacteriales bacterium]
MALLDPVSTWKRLRNRYRLVVMNDDTYEEVVTFKLSRLSVYLAFCTIFVLLVGLTVALIVFTDLKYYMPGYGTQTQKKEMQQLKIRVDSLELSVKQKDQFMKNLKTILSGDVKAQLDTTQLKVPEVEKINE